MILETLLSMGMCAGSSNLDAHMLHSEQNNGIVIISTEGMSETKTDSLLKFYDILEDASKKEKERDYKEAEKLYKESLNWHQALMLPKIISADIHRGLGFVYDRQGRMEESLQHCSVAYQLKPNNLEYINDLAYALAMNDSALTRALELAKTFTGIMPEISDGYRTLGIIYFKMGDYERAERDLRKALELPSQEDKIYFGSIYFFLGKICEKKGEERNAEYCFKKAKELGFIKSDTTNSKNSDNNK